MMKTGISTASLFTKVPTENCFSVLSGMGVNTTEVFLSTYSEYEKGFVDALGQRLGDTLKVHSVHALSSQFEGELFSPSNRVRDDAELLFRKICYAGNVLGAKYYTFHGRKTCIIANLLRPMLSGLCLKRALRCARRSMSNIPYSPATIRLNS